MKILHTSTSFQDTPGKHQELLNKQEYEIDYLRGPLKENELLSIIADYDAVICGDDAFTRNVLEKGKNGNLKFISKYGVGLDKIDLASAKEFGLPVKNCPSVNQISVAEHVFALLLSYCRNIPESSFYTKQGQWVRKTGREIYGKTIGIIGLGAIGREVAKRAKALGLNVLVYDVMVDDNFVQEYCLSKVVSVEELVKKSDIISLHIPLNKDTNGLINKDLIDCCFKNNVILINTARGKLVDIDALVIALDENKVGAYLCDVLDKEPMPENYRLKDFKNVIITPHIGSRTFESVEKQGIMAVNNLLEMMQQSKPNS